MATRNHPPSSGNPAPRLGIVGRTSFFREALIRSLSSETGLVAFDLGSGRDATIGLARTANPDLILVDLPPTEACLLAGLLLEAVPDTRPIAVHRSTEVEEPVRLAEAGYVSFVSNECSLQDLVREIRAAMRDEPICSQRLVGALLRTVRKREPDGSAHLDVLSKREREVAILLERRYCNKEIAAELGIELGTVKNHVHNVLTKLHVHNRWEIPHPEPEPSVAGSRA
jgi:two-component system nitrate/nitrite response regulator NarL